MDLSFAHRCEQARVFARRVGRLVREELLNVDVRKASAETVAGLIPQLSGNYLRTLIWRSAGLMVGEKARILGPLHITGHARWRERLTLGRGTLLTGPVHLDLGARIDIGDAVYLGHDVTLLTVSHEFGGAERRCGRARALPIHIGDGAWLASRVTVLPGVSIGRGAVVAAGAVVTRDVPPNTLVAGVPARMVRSLETDAAPESGCMLRAHAKADTSASPDLRAVS